MPLQNTEGGFAPLPGEVGLTVKHDCADLILRIQTSKAGKEKNNRYSGIDYAVLLVEKNPFGPIQILTASSR